MQLIGIITLNNGKRTTIYCALTISQRYCCEEPSRILAAKLSKISVCVLEPMASPELSIF